MMVADRGKEDQRVVGIFFFYFEGEKRRGDRPKGLTPGHCIHREKRFQRQTIRQNEIEFRSSNTLAVRRMGEREGRGAHLVMI